MSYDFFAYGQIYDLILYTATRLSHSLIFNIFNSNLRLIFVMTERCYLRAVTLFQVLFFFIAAKTTVLNKDDYHIHSLNRFQPVIPATIIHDFLDNFKLKDKTKKDLSKKYKGYELTRALQVALLSFPSYVVPVYISWMCVYCELKHFRMQKFV